jgi:hypothetical protein
VVKGNRITRASTAAYLQAGSLSLDELGGNTGAENASPGTFVSGRVVVGGSWPVSAGGWPTAVGSEMLTIGQGITVTVPADVVVKLAGDVVVQGALSLDGAVDHPAVVTDMSDDHGLGDLEGGGPGDGDYGHRQILVSGAGNNADGFTARHALVRFVPVYVYGPAHVDVEGSTFEGAPGPALTVFGSSAHVLGNTFVRNGLGSVPYGLPKGLTWGPLFVQDDDLDLAALSGNSGAGNGVDRQMIGGTLKRDGVWPRAAVGWTNGVHTVSVAESATLTVPAGVTVPVAWNGGIAVGGRMVAHGDPTAGPVRFTSAVATPGAGDWSGIRAAGASSALDLRDVEVRYAGAMHDNNWSPQSERPAAVDVRGARSVLVLDSRIADAAGAGILVDGVAEPPHIAGNVIDRCGLSDQYGMYAAWAWGVVVNATTIDPALLAGNHGTGNRQPAPCSPARWRRRATWRRQPPAGRGEWGAATRAARTTG